MDEKELNKLKIYAEKSYGLSSILKEYCQIHNDIEEVAIINIVLRYLHKNIDYLNALILNMD